MKLSPVTFGTFQLEDSIPICNCGVDEKKDKDKKKNMFEPFLNRPTNRHTQVEAYSDLLGGCNKAAHAVTRAQITHIPPTSHHMTYHTAVKRTPSANAQSLQPRAALFKILIEVGTNEFLKLLSLHWRDLNCLLTHSMGNKGLAFSMHGKKKKRFGWCGANKIQRSLCRSTEVF